MAKQFEKFQYIFAFHLLNATTDKASTITDYAQVNDLTMTGSHLSIMSAAVVKADSCSVNTAAVIAFKQRQPRSITSRTSGHCFPNERRNWLCVIVLRQHNSV
jgi:hypothetical protein